MNPTSPAHRTSLAHRVAAYVVPHMGGNAPDVSPDEMRRIMALRQSRATAHGPRPFPSRLVPGFRRHFDLAHDDTDGFRTWIFAPTGRPVKRTVYYLHGGSYIASIDPFHVLWTSRLARALDARIVMPDYPVAPTATWRDSHSAVVRDLGAWCTRAAEAGEAPLLLAGDSAGGGYALSAALGLKEQTTAHGGEMPGRIVLQAPWVDLTTSTPETATVALDDPWLDFTKLDVYSQWWAGDDEVGRWELSPVFGSLAGLPPALQLYGTRDLLMPGCRLLQRRADEEGWNLTSVEEPGLLHVYSLFPPVVPEARRAFAQVLDFVGR